MRAMLYDATGKDRTLERVPATLDAVGEQQLLWIDAGTDALPEPFRHCRDDGSAGASRPRICEDRYVFTVPALDRDAPAPRAVTFSVGHNWLVTQGEGGRQAFDRLRDGDEVDTLKGRISASGLAVSLLLGLLEHYRERIAAIDADVDEIEQRVLRGALQRDPMPKLAALRRRVSALRRAMGQWRAVVHGLNRPDFAPHIADDDRAHFAALHEAHQRLEDEVARARETVVGSFGVYATKVSQDTNDSVRLLTVITLVMGVVETITGIFAMNVEVPFLDDASPSSFYLVLSGMALAALGTWLLARWRRWM